jgi:GH24 family phage-related lysozyme (muramidase)
MAAVVPQDAIAIIQEFEGCHAISPADGLIHAYPDPLSGGEPWTIGWGTTVYPDGRRVSPGDVISREQADSFLIAFLERSTWDPISRTIPHWQEMNAPMRSALCSFAYNLGAGFYGAGGFNTISRCLREKLWSEVPAALLLYVNPGSNVEAGLRRRRQAEGSLWTRGLAELQQATPAAAPSLRLIEAITETFLKKQKLDSSQLEPHELVPVETGRQWKIEALLERDGHSQQVQLAYGAGDWWIYAPHWRELSGQELAASQNAAPAPVTSAPQATASGGKDLKVPYHSQLNNRQNPYGSCNVTCVAMCLHHLGMDPRAGGELLEDVLYRRLETEGRSRHNPYDLKALIESYPGFKDIFRENGGFEAIRSSIDAGNPVIIHGYFTSFGHIIVIRGYDNTGFIVNDPYGEWFSSGYDNSRSGDGLHYSYGLIARTCSPESVSNPSHIWYHTVFRV